MDSFGREGRLKSLGHLLFILLRLWEIVTNIKKLIKQGGQYFGNIREK